MVLTIVNRILLMILIMACLNVVRHTYYFIQVWVKSDTESPEKYKISNKSLWLVTFSIGYIISTIFYGVFIK